MPVAGMRLKMPLARRQGSPSDVATPCAKIMLRVMRTGSAAQKTISRAGSLRFGNPGNPIRVAAPAFALADTVSLTAQTATAAGKTTYSDVLATLAATVAATPARKGSLQVLATHELAKET